MAKAQKVYNISGIEVYKDEERIVTRFPENHVGQIDVYVAAGICDAAIKLCKDRPHNFMTIALGTKFSISRAAREFILNHPELAALRLKEAFVCDHPGMLLPAMFLAKCNKAPHPIKAFHSMEAAEKWLESEPEEARNCKIAC